MSRVLDSVKDVAVATTVCDSIAMGRLASPAYGLRITTLTLSVSSGFFITTSPFRHRSRENMTGERKREGERLFFSNHNPQRGSKGEATRTQAPRHWMSLGRGRKQHPRAWTVGEPRIRKPTGVSSVFLGSPLQKIIEQIL